MTDATPRDSMTDLLRLARPAQWSKGVFVLVGPVYGLSQGGGGRDAIWHDALAAACAFAAFGFASSMCYVHNDLRDAEADRRRPRKRNRPIASGAVSAAAASRLQIVLMVLTAAAVAVCWLVGRGDENSATGVKLLAGAVGLYVANTVLYTGRLKNLVILDVMSLSMGFVLRVLGGCAAVMVVPSTWLLNVTLFLSMFLAFGKRLGERRTMGDDAASARAVQAGYTDHFLRMAVVVTAVACLITYAGYVQAKEGQYTWGFNLLWLTMLPATYALLRAIVLVEHGVYDDPTDLATRDRPFQLAAILFVGITLVLMARTVKGLGGG